MRSVAVIGLGYVGLPLAALCATKGYKTIGLESNPTVVNRLNNGECPIKDRATTDLATRARKTGRFLPTSDATDVENCEIYLVCVPTPIDGNNEPDLEPLKIALATVGPFIRRNDIVVIESTVFPGTCEEIVAPILENFSGLRVGIDFELAHCPERVNPGDVFWTIKNIPRVVGAITDTGVEEVAKFYASILGGEILDVSQVRDALRPKFTVSQDSYEVANVRAGSVTMMRSIRDAEAVKAMENTVRDVNIAFVNELAKISDVLRLDVVDIIDGMSTKPFGKGPFFPGVGVGGHCIAVDPEWLKAASKRAGYVPEIIQLSRATNNGMPAYTLGLLEDALGDLSYQLAGTVVAIIGVAYKKNVEDVRESPFFEVRRLLEAKGATLNIFDSWVTSFNNVSSVNEALKGAKAVLIVTDHSDLVSELNALDFSQSSVEIVIDGRNCLTGSELEKMGIIYRGVGRRARHPKSRT